MSGNARNIWDRCHVCSFSSSRLFARRFSNAGIARARRCRPGTSWAARDRRNLVAGETEAAPRGAPGRKRAGGGAADAGRTGAGEEQCLRSEPQQSLHDHRHHFEHADPRHHRRAAAGHQHDGREGAAAGARRVAGFGGERQSPCPQRSRQSAIPHQRRDAARRRHRLRQHSGHRPDRQHCARHRRAAGGVRPAHGRTDRHHDARRRVQQFGQHQPLRRQPRHDHAEFRIWRHVRRQLSDDVVVNRDEGAAIVRERKLLSRRAILLHRPLSADHRRHRKSAADAQRHPRFLAAGAGLWLHVDLHRPVDAAEPDHGNRPTTHSRSPTRPAKPSE